MIRHRYFRIYLKNRVTFCDWSWYFYDLLQKQWYILWLIITFYNLLKKQRCIIKKNILKPFRCTTLNIKSHFLTTIIVIYFIYLELFFIETYLSLKNIENYFSISFPFRFIYVELLDAGVWVFLRYSYTPINKNLKSL